MSVSVNVSYFNRCSNNCSTVNHGGKKHKSSGLPLLFLREIRCHRWIPRTKCQQCGKCLHLMPSPCNWWLTFENLGQGFLTLISPPFTNMSRGHKCQRYVQRARNSQPAHQGKVMNLWNYSYIYTVCKSSFTPENDLQVKKRKERWPLLLSYNPGFSYSASSTMWFGISQVHDLCISLNAMKPGVYITVRLDGFHVASP